MGRSNPAPTARSRALLVAIMMAMTMAARADHVNKSSSSYSGGVYWSSAKEDESIREGDHDDFDGGFSSLDGLLQWAIGHSDPAKLKETAKNAQQSSSDELNKRQLEIKELMEKLKIPSDAQLMQIAIDDLNNSSLSLEDRHHALQELLFLIESIDNPNDFNTLGGLAVIVQELNHFDPDIRRLAAWIIGQISQNNPVIQGEILKLGVLSKLMKMVKSNFIDEATKGLYAVSALVRNNLAGQELFFAEAGSMLLQDILSNSSIDIRLKKKAVYLVGDLAECRLENIDKDELPFLSDRFFLKAVVDLASSSDLDLQEKALITIKNLLQLRTTDALVFKEFCGLEAALGRMRVQLQDLIVGEYQRDFAMDLERLCNEVELIFHRKLGRGGN
ncbi:hypothetical protein FNV43_RR25602 [Rhamnella rubrinervis]|uniref:Nucleotide exchange factor Fes1 domain-containing protein n=1 Tax=Rhamnella rubrinervis TaxID=2594499 RepID=A0A8K0GIV3_9ROSA|nr:hypothetical protein FNV43_RR25602 [Rhamnella rubrinervis]